MLHVCRDFLTLGNSTSLLVPKMAQYYLAIFLRIVLGYNIVGQTNFNIDGGTLRIGVGAAGSINQGAGNEYAFSPNAYVVSTADIGRILVIRSAANPMVNSGLFRVTGIDTGNNWLYIDYRSGDTPPVEASLTWALYAVESVFISSINLSGSGIASSYQGQGAATQSRIILQSPSSLVWQVRIAFENSFDITGTEPNDGSYGATCMPGFGGNAAGDFLAGGQHLHTTLFFNNHTNTYRGTTCGFFPYLSNIARIYIWGDDSTGGVVAIARTVLNGNDSMLQFGVADNEEQPLPPKTVQRLFVIGHTGNGTINTSCIGFGAPIIVGPAGGGSNNRSGMSFGLSNQPVSCVYSLYNRLAAGGFSSASARANQAAGDNPYLTATELQPVDLIAGTIMNQASSNVNSVSILPLEGRRLGQAPILRMGRSNYGYFQITPAGSQLWLHTNDGVYLPWQGSILP